MVSSVELKCISLTSVLYHIVQSYVVDLEDSRHEKLQAEAGRYRHLCPKGRAVTDSQHTGLLDGVA